MNDDDITVEARYEERFRVKHLMMEPPLAGAEHIFAYEENQIRIKFPDLPIDDRIPDDHGEAFISIRKAATGEPLWVSDLAVKLTITDLTFSLPRAAAANPGMNSSLYDAEQTRQLDERSDRLYYQARSAIDYWLRVVRWKTGFALTDLDNRPSHASLHGGRLINCATGKNFYGPRVQRSIAVPPAHRLTRNEWQEIDAALRERLEPPVWHKYLARARQRIHSGDFVAAILDLAVAAESRIRQYLDEKLPAGTPPGFLEILVRTNITNIFDRWIKLGFPPKESFSFATVRKLFDVRNDILHRGNDVHVEASFCNEAADAVQHLLSTLSK